MRRAFSLEEILLSDVKDDVCDFHLPAYETLLLLIESFW